MIKAKDLRITNWVLLDGETFFIRAGEQIDDFSDRMEPIQLTPEMLAKCGFIGLNHLGKREYSLVIDDELTIEACFYDHLVVRLVTRNENCDENINIGEFLTYRELINCEHVHSLQNVCFFITGKELTINL